MRREHIQISIYLFRILLAFVVLITLFTPKRNISLLFFVASILLGFVDYRMYTQQVHRTQVESVLNALADKLLIVFSATALFIHDQLPLWALLIFLAKDLLFMLAGVLTLSKNKHTVFRQTVVSKITLFFQVVAIVAILFDKLDTTLLYTAVALTLLNIIVAYFKPEFRIGKKRVDFDEFAFRKLIKPADLFTLGNVVLGLLCIVFAISEFLLIAVYILLAAVLVDVLDGKLARWTKSQNEFGKQLDSLADTISFGVAPTVIGFSLLQSRLALIGYSIFLACGVLRLAKFNIMETHGIYIGMPITIAGLIVALSFLFGLPVQYWPYLYILLGLLMVAPIQVRKKL
jgi:CDP-diacylglycerol--serine O-phosphatidyltransferase